MSQLTVLLVDDHQAFRRVARAELEDGDVEVIGELDRGAAVVETALALLPDIVLLDIRLPDGDGVALAEDVKEAVPDTAVVLTSSMKADDARERLAAARSSARFLHKTGLSAPALRAIVSG